MSKLEMKVKSEGVDQAARDYDKLSKSEQKAFREAVKLDTQMKKTGNTARASGKGAALSWKQVAAGVGVANVGLKAFQFIQKQIVQEFQNLVNRQQEGVSVAKQWGIALGGLQQNFANFGPDPKGVNQILDKFQDFALGDEGRKGGANAIELLRGATALSSAAGEARVDIIDLVKEANRAKRLNPEVSIETQGSALLTILDELRKLDARATVKDAGNVVGLFGAGAGGSVDILAQKLPALLGSVGVGGKGAFSAADLLSLFAQQTQAFKDVTGEKSVTAVLALSGKLEQIEFELKRQGFSELKGDRAIERVVELAKRFQEGEFSKTQQGFRVLERVGLGERRPAVLNKIAEGADKILTGSAQLQKGSAGGADILGQTLAQRTQLQLRNEAVQAAENSLLQRRIKDEESSGRGAAAAIIKSKRLEAQTEGFFGGTLQDPVRILRDLAGRTGTISPEQQIGLEEEAIGRRGLPVGPSAIRSLFDLFKSEFAFDPEREKKRAASEKELSTEIKNLATAISGGTKSKETVEPTE